MRCLSNLSPRSIWWPNLNNGPTAAIMQSEETAATTTAAPTTAAAAAAAAAAAVSFFPLAPSICCPKIDIYGIKFNPKSIGFRKPINFWSMASMAWRNLWGDRHRRHFPLAAAAWEASSHRSSTTGRFRREGPRFSIKIHYYRLLFGCFPWPISASTKFIFHFLVIWSRIDGHPR